MELEHRNHDDAVDTVLAALRDATPPEGMEARIAQRLQQHAAIAPAAEFRWRDLIAGTTLAGAWGRGALSGAAAAMLVAGVVLFAQHGLRAGSGHEPVAVNQIAATRVVAPSKTSPDQAHGNPCVSPRVLRARSTVPEDKMLLAEALAAVNAPSHPAPELPLTAQERELVQLARTADPKMLAALAPETQAKVDAQEEENFDKFFAPPPAPPQPADSESATNTNQNE